MSEESYEERHERLMGKRREAIEEGNELKMAYFGGRIVELKRHADTLMAADRETGDMKGD